MIIPDFDLNSRKDVRTGEPQKLAPEYNGS
jgi:hypothetical protein